MISDIYQYSEMAAETIVVKRTPTSIKLDEDLWLELKIIALKRKTTATELLEGMIREFVVKEKAKEKPSKK